MRAITPSTDAAEADPAIPEPPESIGLPFGHVLGLLAIGALLLTLWLRHDEPDRPNSGATAPNATGAPAAAAATPPTAGTGFVSLLNPFEQTLPNREPLAGLPGALERFGSAFTIRHPTYLPADVAPFTVNWQPDADPQRRAAGLGELLSWFYSNEHGAVLVLAQGRGVGVRPLTARDDRAGRLHLADGTEVIWLVGHPVRVTPAPPGEVEWDGTEITLGVQATDGEGWYLRSPLISLPELVRIAESLQRLAGSGP